MTTSKDTTQLSDLSSLIGPGLNGSGKAGKVDITSNEYNITGLGLPLSVTNGKTTMNADTLIKALHATAIKDPQAWAGIQYAMYQAHYYGDTMPSLGVWGSSDPTSVNRFLEALTITNPDVTKPANVTSFLTEQQNTAIKIGGNGVRQQIAKVTVPNALDLNYIADKAFRAALGQAPTQKQKDAFTKSYQADVMAVARANAASTAAPTQIPGAMPTPSTSTLPMAPPNPAAPVANTMQQNLAQGLKAPTVKVSGMQDVANADVAAMEFARKSDPTGAGVQGLNTALSDWFKSLGGGGLA
jgi:hypothetical protein